MRLSVFSPKSSTQLFIDLKKLYQHYLSEEELTPAALQDLIDLPEQLFFVTLFNERHLGAVQVSIEQHQAHLKMLCVRDITRRRGVGKNLLREVEKKLLQKSVNSIQLSLNGINEEEREGMVLFMKSCGYQQQEHILTKTLV